MRSIVPQMLVLLLAALSAGCASDPPKPTPTPGDPSANPAACEANGVGVGDIAAQCCGLPTSLTITTGTEAYLPMEPGFEATMVHGPQGGWHVESGLRVTHLRDIVDIHLTLTVVAPGETIDGAVIADDRYYVAVLPEEGCAGLYPYLRSFLNVTDIAAGDADTPPELLSGARANLAMTVTDSDGHNAADTVEIVLKPDPIDVATPTPGGDR